MARVIDNTTDRTAKQRQKVLFNGNALKYYQLCAKAGVEPEDLSLYEQGRLEAFREAKKFSRLEQYANARTQTQETRPQRRTKINYARFWELAQKAGLNYANIFVQTEYKKDILRKAGCTHLKGEGSERITIDSAKPTRIGYAYLHTYQTSERKRKRGEI